ncbi:tripartite tricarboxylate transporter TctB family protein [Thalassobacillus sp. B23F22_16]|uniref:tripartite tricarboxylate transporter TctB family protein n=1 Tax=Thalassobacillus sp. B23F22_16 TaxID=3459513 RepID=UPI00373F2203
MTHELKNLLFLLCIGAFALIYFFDVRTLPDPEEKNLVMWLLIGLGFLLVFDAGRSLYKGFRSKESGLLFFKDWWKWGKSKEAILVYSVVGYVALIPVIGFFVTSFVFVLVLNLVLKNRKWWESIIIPTILLIAVYIMFVWFLGVDLPQGFII